MARILFTTFGSYGDLHPYMALGIELRNRGHRVTIATSATYGPKVASEGLGFHPVRPDVSLDDRERLAYVFDARRGSERVVRLWCSVVRETYDDTLPAAGQADLIVTHPITFAAVLVAQKLRMPWISSVLAPISFLSAWDPPVAAPAPWMVKLRAFGPGVMKAVWNLGRWDTFRWMRPVLEFRRELGLGPTEHPLFEGANSPALVLALFSKYMAEPQPDWPRQAVVTGFQFYDRHHEQREIASELYSFLTQGPAPLIFTLGTSAVGAAGDFYRDSLDAVQSLRMRALFLTGSHPQGLPDTLPDGVMTAAYAPHSEVFPRAAAIVHQGGIGTTGQAMRSGRPMLVVPFAHDQFDNGDRMRRVSVGEVLYRSRYNARRAAERLRRLVENPSYAQAGAILSKRVEAENGRVVAADAVEACLKSAGATV